MGVAGSGKTTVGRLLADAMGGAYAEGDDYHSKDNVAKMESGVPLDDTDRAPWLASMAADVDRWLATDKCTVLACSALKQRYRDVLIGNRENIALVHLTGAESLIRERLAARKSHYMPAGLLDSQLATLEAPDDALTVDIGPSPEEIAAGILGRLRRDQATTISR
jgi:gluconokinase